MLASAAAASAEGSTAAAHRQSLQWLFAPEDLALTPSVRAGIAPETERALRAKGVSHIFRIGESLRCGLHVLSTAALFFHRFYMRRALLPPGTRSASARDTFAIHELAPAALWLACKVEESHRRVKDVVEYTMMLNDKTPDGLRAQEKGEWRVDQSSREFGLWRDSICYCETAILEALCFDLIVDCPHYHLTTAARLLGASWNVTHLAAERLTNLFFSALVTCWDAPILAACAFEFACREVGIDPATFSTPAEYRCGDEPSQGWLDAFDVDATELDDALPRVADFLAEHALHPTHRTAGPSAGGSALPSTAVTPRARTDGSAPITSLGGTPLGFAGLSDPATPAAATAQAALAANPPPASLLAPVAGPSHAKAPGPGFSPSSPSTHARPPSRHGSAPTGAFPPAFGAATGPSRLDDTRLQERANAVAPSATTAESATAAPSTSAYVPLSPPGLRSATPEGPARKDHPPPAAAPPTVADTGSLRLSSSDAAGSTGATLPSTSVKRPPAPSPPSSDRVQRRRIDVEEREEGESSEEEGAL